MATINGTSGNDSLVGTLSNDLIFGLVGDDTLDGGVGNDTLSGGLGNDTYRYAPGGGNDTISNFDAAAVADVLVFGAGILPSALTIDRSGGVAFVDLYLFPGGFGNSVMISEYFNTGNTGAVDEIRFTDDPGTVWMVASVKAMLLAANDSANILLGYETADTIDGLGGNDNIQGLAANDTLYGGAGNDTLRGNTENDQIDGGAGNDIIYGNGGADALVGAAGDDRLNGEEFDNEGPGDDTLDGGAGRDVLIGRHGNDTFVFGRGYGHDEVMEAASADGNDTLRLAGGVVPADVVLYRSGDFLVLTIAGDTGQAWIWNYFTLANKPIEQIVFDDSTTWNTADIAVRVIASTQDTMTGTAGDDTFIVDSSSDSIVEGPNQGTDTVESSVTYTLPANVENLTLTGNLDLGGSGNTLANVITGNAGNNNLLGSAGDDTLSGGPGDDTLLGGAGADSLVGGQGNDSYMADASDVVVEAAGQGIDTIVGDFTSIPDNIENLTVQLGVFFTVGITGNALDNVITGRVGVANDIYDGGAGADTMIASGGTFTVDNPGDTVVTTDGAATYIRSAIDWTLTGSHKRLELIDIGGVGVNATGNAANNDIAGNTRANTLAGLAGNDTLAGGIGNDTLIGGAGVDTAAYSGARAGYTISSTVPNFTVSGLDGSDALSSVERLRFSDKKVAIDVGLGQAAGNTVRIIGAAFDAPMIQQHPDWVGIGLQFFDGGMGMLQVCELVAQQVMGLGNTAFVTRVYTNVVGVAPDAVTLNAFVSLLQGSGGTMTQADLLMLAANAPLNEVNIDFVGLQHNGAEFV